MGLQKDILEQPVSSLPLRDIITVLPSSTVRQAVRKMQRKGLGCVVVVDENNRPLGKFTERILIRMLASLDESVLDEPIKSHMFPVDNCVKHSEPIAKVLDYMKETGLRFVCVTDDDGKKMIGLTGQRGVMEYIADHFPRAVKSQLLEAKLYMDEREGA